MKINYFHKKTWNFIDFHWFSMIFHENSLIFIDFHWKSLIYVETGLKKMCTDLHTDTRFQNIYIYRKKHENMHTYIFAFTKWHTRVHICLYATTFACACVRARPHACSRSFFGRSKKRKTCHCRNKKTKARGTTRLGWASLPRQGMLKTS